MTPATGHLVINERSVSARLGETLVDAGLGGWIAIPHDCCSGQCGRCRVTVLSGHVDDRGTADGATVLACQATVAGDAEVAFEDAPRLSRTGGVLTAIASLAPTILELVVKLDRPVERRPGQCFGVKFSGLPARDLAPSLRTDGNCAANELIFHLRRYPGGLLSTEIGATIRPGQRVRVRGPAGHAYLREGSGPLVLVSGGVGWAPIWSMAHAARLQQPHRDMVVIAGVSDAPGLYMRRSLEWLKDRGVRDVIATCENGACGFALPGRPTHYLPSLGPEDTVHVAGPPALVEAVKRKARAAGARCYAIPFLPGMQQPSLMDRVVRLLSGSEPLKRGAPALPNRMRSTLYAREARTTRASHCDAA
jgi:NAD(P)H-flavin reductase/ferredoxin